MPEYINDQALGMQGHSAGKGILETITMTIVERPYLAT